MQECNSQAFIKGVMLGLLLISTIINSLMVGSYIYTPHHMSKIVDLFECVYSVLVRYLGCGDCLYLSSRERNRRALSFQWNIQAGTRLCFGLLVSVEASFGRRKATTRVL